MTEIEKLEEQVHNQPHDPRLFLDLKGFYDVHDYPVEAKIKLLKDGLSWFPTSLKLIMELAAVYEFEADDVLQALFYYEQALVFAPDEPLILNAIEALNLV
jgi:hypothetical protein